MQNKDTNNISKKPLTPAMEVNSSTFLSMIVPGEDVTLIDIHGGRGVRSKLYSMGLVPGVNFRILNRNGSGPVMIEVKDSRLAIGRGMAEKIIVE